MKKEFECIKASPDEIISTKKITSAEYRDEFIRDRDRILYSKEFRRLSGKTQIFVSSFGDSTRTRLTHSLEVSQIATSIAKALGLNIFLTEAIALGHDIGHTPFGHAGERTLDLIMNGCIDCYGYNRKLKDKERGFKHNLQSIRVACELEEGYEENKGLNLCNYTLWGILNHTKTSYGKCDYCSRKKKCNYKNSGKRCNNRKTTFYIEDFKEKGIELNEKNDWTLEAIIVGVADEIAQRHHDIEDGIFADLIDENDLINKFEELKIINEEKKTELINVCKGHDKTDIIQRISEVIINYYSNSYINKLKEILNPEIEKITREKENDYKKIRQKVYYSLTNNRKSIIDVLGFSKELLDVDEELKKFIIFRVHKSNITQNMDGKASYIIVKLMKAYISNPQQLPDRTIIGIVQEIKKDLNIGVGKARDELNNYIIENTRDFRVLLLRKICDHIAGMTDQYAIEQFNKLYNVK